MIGKVSIESIENFWFLVRYGAGAVVSTESNSW